MNEVAKRVPTLPMEPEDARLMLLEEAGWGREELKKLTQESMLALERGLRATLVKYTTHGGRFSDKAESEDTASQLKAVREVIELLGLKAPRASSAGGGQPVVVNVAVQGFAKETGGNEEAVKVSKTSLNATEVSRSEVLEEEGVGQLES